MLGSDLAKLATGEDMQSLRTLLVNMFKEADVDNCGFMCFNDFQALMEKIDLGKEYDYCH